MGAACTTAERANGPTASLKSQMFGSASQACFCQEATPHESEEQEPPGNLDTDAVPALQAAAKLTRSASLPAALDRGDKTTESSLCTAKTWPLSRLEEQCTRRTYVAFEEVLRQKKKKKSSTADRASMVTFAGAEIAEVVEGAMPDKRLMLSPGVSAPAAEDESAGPVEVVDPGMPMKTGRKSMFSVIEQAKVEHRPLHVRYMLIEFRRATERRIAKLGNVVHSAAAGSGDPRERSREVVAKAKYELEILEKRREQLERIGPNCLNLPQKLLTSAYAGDKEFVDFCLKAGIPPNIQNETGQTPIILATITKKLSVVKFLIAMRADLGIQDMNGATCVHYAVHCDSVHALEAMLSTDDREVAFLKDIQGRTVFDYAYRSESQDCLKFLRFHFGGNIGIGMLLFRSRCCGPPKRRKPTKGCIDWDHTCCENAGCTTEAIDRVFDGAEWIQDSCTCPQATTEEAEDEEEPPQPPRHSTDDLELPTTPLQAQLNELRAQMESQVESQAESQEGLPPSPAKRNSRKSTAGLAPLDSVAQNIESQVVLSSSP